MKPGILLPVFFAVMTAGFSLILTGCASSGVKRSAQTNKTMEAVEADYKRALEQVDITGVALEELIQPSQSNVKEAFEKYSKNVDKMEELKKSLFEHADEMREHGSEYFDEWRKEGSTITQTPRSGLSVNSAAPN